MAHNSRQELTNARLPNRTQTYAYYQVKEPNTNIRHEICSKLLIVMPWCIRNYIFSSFCLGIEWVPKLVKITQRKVLFSVWYAWTNMVEISKLLKVWEKYIKLTCRAYCEWTPLEPGWGVTFFFTSGVRLKRNGKIHERKLQQNCTVSSDFSKTWK